MWIRFGPAWAQWLSVVLFGVMILGVLAMPKDERARFLRSWWRGPAERPPPVDVWMPADPGHSTADPDDALSQRGPIRLRETSRSTTVLQFAIVIAAGVMLALFAWGAIVFLTNLPGWR